MHFVELFLFHGRGRVHHQVARVFIHGERDHFADIDGIADKHDHSVDAGGNACVRRRAVFKRVIKRGELAFHNAFIKPDERKRFQHDFGVVVAHRARRKLDPVANDIVLIGENVERVFFKRAHAALRHGEGVVAEFERAALFADLIHGEIDDPAETEHVFFEQIKPRAEHRSQNARALLGKRKFVFGDERNERIVLQAERIAERAELFGKEFGNPAHGRAVFVEAEPISRAAFGFDFEIFDKFIDPFTRLRKVVDGDRLYGFAFDGGESAAVEQVRNVLHEQGVSKVGLVRTVIFERFAVRNAAEGRFIGGFAREFRKHGGQHAFEHGEHVVLRGERHFDIELIKFAGGTVGARILVAETGRDLKIFIEPRAH